MKFATVIAVLALCSGAALARGGPRSFNASVPRLADISDSAEIDNSQIGDDIVIGDDTRVRDSVIGDDVIIGNDGDIRDSYIGEETEIGNDAVIRDSVIGEKVVIGDDVTILTRTLATGWRSATTL